MLHGIHDESVFVGVHLHSILVVDIGSLLLGLYVITSLRECSFSLWKLGPESECLLYPIYRREIVAEDKVDVDVAPELQGAWRSIYIYIQSAIPAVSTLREFRYCYTTRISVCGFSGVSKACLGPVSHLMIRPAQSVTNTRSDGHAVAAAAAVGRPSP